MQKSNPLSWYHCTVFYSNLRNDLFSNVCTVDEQFCCVYGKFMVCTAHGLQCKTPHLPKYKFPHKQTSNAPDFFSLYPTDCAVYCVQLGGIVFIFLVFIMVYSCIGVHFLMGPFEIIQDVNRR